MIGYIYPKDASSFSIAAREYIYAIKSLGHELIELSFDDPLDDDVDLYFAHPFFYSVSKLLPKLSGRKLRLVGMDVADSTLISRQYIDFANRHTIAFVVPSSFSKFVYAKSGYTKKVFVWRHFLMDWWWFGKSNTCVNVKESDLRVLFFHRHSFHRKGGDVLYRAIKLLKDRGYNVHLVVVGKPDMLNKLDPQVIEEALSIECLMGLYESVDVTALPSRGGGFERNGLESFARGTPVVAPRVGAWVEYFPPELNILLAEVSHYEQVLPGNPIHVGFGPVADVEDFAAKLVLAKHVDVRKFRAWWFDRFSLWSVARTIEKDLNTLFHGVEEAASLLPAVLHTSP